MDVAFRKILLCLDLTEMDDFLLTYTEKLLKTFTGVEEVVVFHNIHFELPEYSEIIQDELHRPLSELIRDSIEKKLSALNNHASIKTTIKKQKDTARAIEEAVVENESSLIIMGLKNNYQGSGYLIKRVMDREMKISVLSVPETSKLRFTKCLMALNFDPKSVSSVDSYYQYLKGQKKEINLMHVFTVPTIYFPYIPDKDIKEKFLQNSKKKFKKFSKNLTTEIDENDITFSFSDKGSIPFKIVEEAVEKEYNFLILPFVHPSYFSKIHQILEYSDDVPVLFYMK